MATAAIVKDPNFELVSEFAQTDAKKRVSLGEAIPGRSAFNIYRNGLGQIVLDPVRAIPANEAWLFGNPAALAAVTQGLKESAAGRRVDRGSFAKYATKR